MYLTNYRDRFSNFVENLIIERDSDTLGLLFSFLLHLSIITVSLGIPSCFQQKSINIPNIIPIEIINIDEVTNVPLDINENKEDKKEKKTESKEVKFSSAEQTEIVKIQEPIIDEAEAKEEVEIVPRKDEVEIKIDLKPVIKETIENEKEYETLPSKKIRPKMKPKPKPELLKEQDIDISIKLKAKPKPNFSISSVLKDLREESVITQPSEQDKSEKNNENDNNDINSNTFTISEIDLLKQQLYGCWTVPTGIDHDLLRKIVVPVKIKVNPNRTVSNARIIDTNEMQGTVVFRSVAESALRAVLNPACSPLKLPPDKYETWKEIKFVFQFEQMLGN